MQGYYSNKTPRLLSEMTVLSTEPAKKIDVIHERSSGCGLGAGRPLPHAAARAGFNHIGRTVGCFGGNITTVGVEGFAGVLNKQLKLAAPDEFEDRASFGRCCSRKSEPVL